MITRQPSSTVVQAFGIASFQCTARSYGVASITWKRLNSKLPITADITVTKSLNEITSVLRLESIGYYKGYYYCVIENSVGIVNSTFAYFDITGNQYYVLLNVCSYCINNYTIWKRIIFILLCFFHFSF